MTSQTDRSIRSEATSHALTIPLPELDCVSCAHRLRLHLSRIEGLDYKLSLTEKSVTLPPGSTPDSIQQAIAAIWNNGFEPGAARIFIPLFDLPVGSPAAVDIENSLEGSEGVLRAIVHVTDQAVEVWYVPGRIDIAEIRQQIRRTGHRNEAPAGSAEIESRLDKAHRRMRLEAIAAVAAAILITFLSIPLAGERTPTVAEPVASASRTFVQGIVPQLFSIDPVGLEITILFVTFGFLVWLGRSWMESGSFTLLGRNPDSNTTAAAAVFVLAAGLTISSIRVAWLEDPSYAFPGYATLFWMISLYSLARLMESREMRRIRAKDAALGVRSTARGTEIQQSAETTMSLTLRVIICVAIASFVLWFDFAPDSPLLYAVIAFAGIMIVALPSLFALAAPSAISTGMQEVARRGVIVRDAQAFEDLSRLRKIAILKEGVLTEGRPATSDFVLLGGIDQRELLEAAASLAALAQSDLGRAVVARAGQFTPRRVSEFHESPGRGFRGMVNGIEVAAGTPRFVESLGFSLEGLNEELTRYGSEGKNSLVFAINGNIAGLIALRDAPLEGADRAVARLEGLGVTTHLFGSDETATLEAIAAGMGIRHVTAEVEPRLLRGSMADAKESGKPLAVLCAERGDGLLLTAADLPIA
ncbi:MAG TPA: heavy metal translocating P-type ATPase, partial [Thermoanaerobaculia bacterium]|nr:heavy metal translocating P-type ATPase [Thermoanaerobaculia bacterium]